MIAELEAVSVSPTGSTVARPTHPICKLNEYITLVAVAISTNGRSVCCMEHDGDSRSANESVDEGNNSLRGNLSSESASKLASYKQRRLRVLRHLRLRKDYYYYFPSN
jgi:hypothetical protein